MNLAILAKLPAIIQTVRAVEQIAADAGWKGSAKLEAAVGILTALDTSLGGIVDDLKAVINKVVALLNQFGWLPKT